jgi:hypothetical protein
MAYENTHLWAADTIRAQFRNQALGEIISKGIDYFYLGSVFPDTCSYSRDRGIRKISDRLHGETGIASNEVVFDVLDRIIQAPDENNFAFICGYLTHMAIDIVFHPMVVYISGYLPRQNSKRASHSSYLHWLYETFIDKHFNNRFYLDQMIKPAIVRNLIILSVLNVPEQAAEAALHRQISYFRRVNSRFYYWVYRLAIHLRFIDKKYIGGFYAHLNYDRTGLPEKIHFRDLFSGEEKEATLDSLMNRSLSMGKDMLSAAYDYYCGKIDRETCKNTIVGHNLDTGQSGRTKADIRFAMDQPGQPITPVL